MADFTYNNNTLCLADGELFSPAPISTGVDTAQFDPGQIDAAPLNTGVDTDDIQQGQADPIPQNILVNTAERRGFILGGPFTTRMKGFDTTLSSWVYWSSANNDPLALNYRGPGPVTRTVVAFVFPQGQRAPRL